jgi:hypothetical protein
MGRVRVVFCVLEVENRKIIFFPHVPQLGWFGLKFTVGLV